VYKRQEYIDNLGPVWTANAFNIDSDGDYTISPDPVDAGYGLATSETYTIKDSITGIIYLDKFTATSGNIPNITPSVTAYKFVCVARDTNGNESESNIVEVTISVAADPGTIGIVAQSYEVTEGNSLNIPVNWDGADAGGASCTMSTVDNPDSATAPTNYVAQSGTTITWATAGNQNFTLAANDQSSATNNQMYVQIDWQDPASRDPANSALGFEVCEVIINSSGSGTAGLAERTLGTGEQLIIWEAENDTSGTAVASETNPTNSWVTTTNDRCSENLRTTSNDATDYGTSGALQLDVAVPPYKEYLLNITTAAATTWNYHCRMQADQFNRYIHPCILRKITSIGADDSGGAGFQLITTKDPHSYQNGDLIYFDTPSGNYDNTPHTISSVNGPASTFEIANTGNGAESSLTDGWSFGEATMLGHCCFSYTTLGESAEFYNWASTNVTSTARQFTTEGADQYKLRVYVQHNRAELDRMCICDTVIATWNPDVAVYTDELDLFKANSKDDNYGETVSSSTVGGTPTDDTEITDVFPLPLPLSTIAPTTLTPANVGQITQSKFQINFSGSTQLQVNHWQPLLGGSEINGFVEVFSDFATFTPTATLVPGSYDLSDIEGRIVDSAGSMKSINVAAWTATIPQIVGPPDPGGDVVWQMDLSGYSPGSEGIVITPSMATSIFNGTPSAINTSTFQGGRIRIVVDPFGSGRNVLQIPFFQGRSGSSQTGGHWIVPLGSHYDEIYFSFGYAVEDAVWVSPRAIHGPFILSDNFVATQAADPDNEMWAVFQDIRGFNDYVFAEAPFTVGSPSVDDALVHYVYHTTKHQQDSALNLDRIDGKLGPSVLPANQAILGRDTFNHLETRLKLDSVTGATSNQDAILQGWFNGQQCQNYTGAQHGVVFRNTDGNNQKIDNLRMQFFANPGGLATMPKDQNLYVDHVIVSTGPIGH